MFCFVYFFLQSKGEECPYNNVEIEDKWEAVRKMMLAFIQNNLTPELIEEACEVNTDELATDLNEFGDTEDVANKDYLSTLLTNDCTMRSNS